MSGKKKNPEKSYSNWGGKRENAGRKLKSNSDFSVIYQKYLEKYGDPVEAHFRIMQKTEAANDPVSMKLHLESSKQLMNKHFPNPTETFEDEDGNTIVPSSDINSQLASMMERLANKGNK